MTKKLFKSISKICCSCYRADKANLGNYGQSKGYNSRESIGDGLVIETEREIMCIYIVIKFDEDITDTALI